MGQAARERHRRRCITGLVLVRAAIVIPTYNERENIGPLLAALERQFQSTPHEWHIVVVDDNSPDGTAEAVRQYQKQFGNIHLLEGPKAGLGSAYIRGLRHALDELNANVVLQMDGDLSHRPEDVLPLMAALEAGADFVIGSRYVKGGSIPRNWELHRKLMSFFGNLVARYIVGLYRVRDCTAGFRAIRASVLRQIELDHLRVRGYAFQVALLHAAMIGGAKIVEVPVDFIDRTNGESKLGLSDIVEFAINVGWIRLRSSATLIKLLIVGATGAVVNLGCFSLLLAAGMNKYLASPVAIELSILANFIFNNYWTFRRRRSGHSLAIKGLKFNSISFLSLALSYSAFIALSAVFPETPPQIHQLIAIVPATLVNYFLNSYWTFAQAPGTSRD